MDWSEALKIHKGKSSQSCHDSQLRMGPQPWGQLPGSRGEEIHTKPLSHLSDISPSGAPCVTSGNQWLGKRSTARPTRQRPGLLLCLQELLGCWLWAWCGGGQRVWALPAALSLPNCPPAVSGRETFLSSKLSFDILQFLNLVINPAET